MSIQADLEPIYETVDYFGGFVQTPFASIGTNQPVVEIGILDAGVGQVPGDGFLVSLFLGAIF